MPKFPLSRRSMLRLAMASGAVPLLGQPSRAQSKPPSKPTGQVVVGISQEPTVFNPLPRDNVACPVVLATTTVSLPVPVLPLTAMDSTAEFVFTDPNVMSTELLPLPPPRLTTMDWTWLCR